MIFSTNMEQIVFAFIFYEQVLLIHEDLFLNLEDEAVLDKEEKTLLFYVVFFCR